MNARIRQTLLRSVEDAGHLLLKYFGRVRNIRQKGPQSSVVCEADLASEELVARQIRKGFPGTCIIGEEGGCTGSNEDLTWVVDPLDGTSNFVAGLPWFGAQAGVLVNNEPVCAAMYLPVDGTLYYAEKGGGTFRNRQRVTLAAETNLKNTLWAFGFDASSRDCARTANLLVRLAGGIRNTRATNSLFDFCYTLDGCLGGCVNLNCKIWDIVPAALMFAEAGGRFTTLEGEPIDFRLGQADLEHSYEVLGAGRVLHSKALRLLSPPGQGRGPL